MSDLTFSIDLIDKSDDAVVLAVRGELDLSTAPRLRSALTDYDGASITLDLAETSFVDSTAIGLLVAAFNRAERAGRSFKVRNVVQTAPRRTFEIVGIYEMLAEQDGQA